MWLVLRTLKTKTGYIHFIESLRAFAALAVLLFHFVSYYNGQQYIIKNETVRDVSSFGAQGVELFYVISGFVIAYSLTKNNYTIRNYGQYFLKRILRIIPVYWLAVLSTYAAVFVIGKLFWGSTLIPSMKELFGNAFFIVDLVGENWVNPVFETLAVEMQFYILIGLLFPLFVIGKQVKYFVLLIWMIAAYLTRDSYTVLMNAPFFITGILLFDIYKQKQDWVASAFIVGIAVFLSLYYPWDDVVILALTILCFVWLKPSFKWSNWIGNFSYSIYLTHGLIGGWILYYLSGFSDQLSPWIMIIIATAASIIGGYVFYRIIEIPAIKWSRGINWKSKQLPK